MCKSALPEGKSRRTFGGMPLITGIDRIYKNKATVNRPDSADTPTNGLGEKKKKVRDRETWSAEVIVSNKVGHEPGKRGGICPDPGEYGRGAQPVGDSSTREEKTKLAGDVSGRHKAEGRSRSLGTDSCRVGSTVDHKRNHMSLSCNFYLSSASKQSALGDSIGSISATFYIRRNALPPGLGLATTCCTVSHLIVCVPFASLNHQRNHNTRQAYCDHYTNNGTR
jgi:hypothetical protein